MPVYPLPRAHIFPDPRRADPNGLVAIGGDLQVGRILAAYRAGIFPWFSPGQPILWWSPDPRMVLQTSALEVPRSLRKRMKQAPYKITLDTAFASVIDACATTPRPGQQGTWITTGMRDAYIELFRQGFAHSAEAWDADGTLVGGVYGVAVGRSFSGESMFAHAPDASKIAFVVLVNFLRDHGFPLVDCQMYTDHLARFGAREVPRAAWLDSLDRLVRLPPFPGPWALPAGSASPSGATGP